METIYLCIVIFLFVLAVFDLIVGVSNDASQFSPIISRCKSCIFQNRVVYRRYRRIHRCSIVQRHDGYCTARYLSATALLFCRNHVYLLAVMLTDVVLLDVFNTMGMPTSTTVSMVFELLGGTFALALIKVNSSDTLGLGDLINTDKALSVIWPSRLRRLLSSSVGWYNGWHV